MPSMMAEAWGKVFTVRTGNKNRFSKRRRTFFQPLPFSPKTGNNTSPGRLDAELRGFQDSPYFSKIAFASCFTSLRNLAGTIASASAPNDNSQCASHSKDQV